MVHLIDHWLPTRFQLSTIDHIILDRDDRGMTEREHLKHMRALWRSIGPQVSRSRRLPAPSASLPMIHAVAGKAAVMYGRDMAGKPMEVGYIAHILEPRFLSY